MVDSCVRMLSFIELLLQLNHPFSVLQFSFTKKGLPLKKKPCLEIVIIISTNKILDLLHNPSYREFNNFKDSLDLDFHTLPFSIQLKVHSYIYIKKRSPTQDGSNLWFFASISDILLNFLRRLFCVSNNNYPFICVRGNETKR